MNKYYKGGIQSQYLGNDCWVLLSAQINVIDAGNITDIGKRNGLILIKG